MDSEVVIDVETWLRLPGYVKHILEAELERTKRSQEETKKLEKKD